MRCPSASDRPSAVREMIDIVTVEQTAATITDHGVPVAVVAPHSEWESMAETIEILSDDELMAAIAEGEDDFSAGRFISIG